MMKLFCAKNSLSCVLLLSFLLPMSAYAEESNQTTTLKGGVVTIEVSLDNLRDARLSISRVRKAAANLYDEVTRQHVSVNYNPNVVGGMVINVPTPSFTGQMLPPRKKWIKEAMSEIGPIIELFKEDVDAAIESNRHTNVSEAARKQLDPLRETAFASVKSSAEIYKELEKLTAGPDYDNSAIASTSRNLDSTMKQLDKSLKKGLSVLQKEAKKTKAS